MAGAEQVDERRGLGSARRASARARGQHGVAVTAADACSRCASPARRCRAARPPRRRRARRAVQPQRVVASAEHAERARATAPKTRRAVRRRQRAARRRRPERAERRVARRRATQASRCARPWLRLARFATGERTRRRRAPQSSSTSHAGSSCAAPTNGSVRCPAAQSASSRKCASARRALERARLVRGLEAARVREPARGERRVGQLQGDPARIRTASTAARAAGRVAGVEREHDAVGAHLVGLGVDLDRRQRVVEHHVALAEPARRARRRAACASPSPVTVSSRASGARRT